MTETQRVEAFSDGVFAIAITLLIIEIGVPDVEGSASLTDALLDLWPSYLAYVFSFITIGIMWANHHSLFKDIVRVDHWLLILNLLLLLCIAFVPFPTALLAEYLSDGAHRLEATLAYIGSFTVTAIAFNVLWLYLARNRHLLDDSLSEDRIRTRTIRYAVGPISNAVTLPLAFISPWLSIAVFGLLWSFYLLPYRD